MNITMYSTTSCVTCKGLGDWLNKNGFEYEKKMADSSPEIMTEFLAASDGMIGVPFTIITKDDGSVSKIAGYDHKEFTRVLGL